MAGKEAYTDEYVAKALKQDAQDRSTKYSSLGLQAFLPSRTNRPTAKPNTRFLQNILRDTDNHNAALLAKEKREAREKQREFSRSLDKNGDPSGSRRSKWRDRSSDETSRKRSRRDFEEATPRHHRDYGRLSRSPSRSVSSSGSRSPSPRRPRTRRRSASPAHRLDERKQRRNHDAHQESSRACRRGKHRRRSRSNNPDDSDGERRVRNGKNHSRENNERRRHKRRSGDSKRRRSTSSRSRSPPSKRRRHGSISDEDEHGVKVSTPSTSSGKAKEPAKAAKRQISNVTNDADDSDPLEALVGPLPPPPGPKPRGRGVAKATSNIDNHFAAEYNPSEDLSPGSEEDGENWENAVEAFRDRQKWKNIGAERLRQAGFGDEEVKRWESGINGKEREKDERDVRWTRKGEGREWDRGKVVDASDGDVRLEAEWGRLKGT